jgi:hypothetical protein
MPLYLSVTDPCTSSGASTGQMDCNYFYVLTSLHSLSISVCAVT